MVDDGSPFDIAGVVAAHPRTTLLRRSNGGSALARNDGHRRGARRPLRLSRCRRLPPSGGALERPARSRGASRVWLRHRTTRGDDLRGRPGTLGCRRLAARVRALHHAAVVRLVHHPALVGDVPPERRRGGGRLSRSLGSRRPRLLPARGARPPRPLSTTPPVTRYRRYSSSSSRDGERMLTSIRAVYARQWPLVRGNAVEERAFHRGLQLLTEIFRDCAAENLRDRLRAGQWRRALRSARVLARESPRLLAQETGRSVKSLLRGVAKGGDRAGGETSSDGSRLRGWMRARGVPLATCIGNDHRPLPGPAVCANRSRAVALA